MEEAYRSQHTLGLFYSTLEKEPVHEFSNFNPHDDYASLILHKMPCLVKQESQQLFNFTYLSIIIVSLVTIQDVDNFVLEVVIKLKNVYSLILEEKHLDYMSLCMCGPNQGNLSLKDYFCCCSH